MTKSYQIAVIGLGYVGLPLAVALARRFDVVGFDIAADRVNEIAAGHDRTGEVADAALKATRLVVTDDPNRLAGRGIYIVTVPTPVDQANKPDLGPVRAASVTVGRHLGKGAIVVYESTVYPGVTEDICGPILERESGLTAGKDFFLGYSPERINPGDREHTVDRITKVVSGQTEQVVDVLAEIYGSVTSGGVFRARSIKTAEAAKVIENAQRDINIAFINEVTMIFHRLGLNAADVFEAAKTKWNFLDFRPGLVGGHCIGVDPYYLATRAIEVGHDPAVILAGRRINDGMGPFVAAEIARRLTRGNRVLVLGLTFKENVPDLRNTKVIDVVAALRQAGLAVDVHDALADRDEAREHYDLDLLVSLDGAAGYDAVVGAVAHAQYRALGPERLLQILRPGGLVADVKGVWRGVRLPDSLRRWEL
jgi:UDP-N-acetyl-D-galactosamine dehydrogenase